MKLGHRWRVRHHHHNNPKISPAFWRAEKAKRLVGISFLEFCYGTVSMFSGVQRNPAKIRRIEFPSGIFNKYAFSTFAMVKLVHVMQISNPVGRAI